MPLKLAVPRGQKPEAPDADRLLAESVHHHVAYRHELNLSEFHRLMREGWTSLPIGLTFLAVCVASRRRWPRVPGGWHPFMSEGLATLGWVAMWRPLDIYLYR